MTDPCLTPQLAGACARKSTLDDMGLKRQDMVNVQKATTDQFTVPDDPAFRFEDDDTSGRRTNREDLDRRIALITSGKAPFSRICVKDLIESITSSQELSTLIKRVTPEVIGAIETLLEHDRAGCPWAGRPLDSFEHSSPVRPAPRPPPGSRSLLS